MSGQLRRRSDNVLPHDLVAELAARMVAQPGLDAGPAAYHARTEAIESSYVLLRWASDAPEQAVALHGNLPPVEAERALFSIAAGVAEVYPSRAAAMVTSQPESIARDFAIQVVAAHWAQQDPRAAADWAQSLPPGPVRDLAIRNVRNWGAAFDPSLAGPE